METRVAAPLQCSEPTDLHTSHFLICIFLPSLPRISLFSLSYFSPFSLVFSFSLFHIFPLPPLYFPFLSFTFLHSGTNGSYLQLFRFLLTFPNGFLAKTNRLQNTHTVNPNDTEVKIQNMRDRIVQLLCAKKVSESVLSLNREDFFGQEIPNDLNNLNACLDIVCL